MSSLVGDGAAAEESLTWRTALNHTDTVLDLPETEQLLGTGAAEMSCFAHHQPEDKFDVLHPTSPPTATTKCPGRKFARFIVWRRSTTG